MAGWNLKESTLKKEFLEYEILEKIANNIKISKKQNSYKYLLLLTLLNCCKKNFNEVEIIEVINKIVHYYIELLNCYIPNKKEKQNLLYRKVIEINLKTLNKKEIGKEFKFLENYVFGALAVDTQQLIFGFSKKENKVYLNETLNKSMCDRLYDITFNNLIEEFFEQRKIKKERKE